VAKICPQMVSPELATGNDHTFDMYTKTKIPVA